MKEEKFAVLAVRIWRAKQRVERMRKPGNNRTPKQFLNAKDKLRLALVRFSNAVLA
jgi:hypothetical protein